MSAASIRVHGIRPSELLRAPLLEDVADELIVALEGRTLVAFAATIELAFLTRLCRQLKRRGPRRAIDVVGLVARDRRPGGVRSWRLADLAEEYGLPVARTHHALGDALTTAQLFLVLASRMEGRGRSSVRDLERAGRSQFATSSLRPPLDLGRPLS
jgi:DNA polymerase-3 subunit epsilon